MENILITFGYSPISSLMNVMNELYKRLLYFEHFLAPQASY